MSNDNVITPETITDAQAKTIAHNAFTIQADDSEAEMREQYGPADYMPCVLINTKLPTDRTPAFDTSYRSTWPMIDRSDDYINAPTLELAQKLADAMRTVIDSDEWKQAVADLIIENREWIKAQEERAKRERQERLTDELDRAIAEDLSDYDKSKLVLVRRTQAPKAARYNDWGQELAPAEGACWTVYTRKGDDWIQGMGYGDRGDAIEMARDEGELVAVETASTGKWKLVNEPKPKQPSKADLEAEVARLKKQLEQAQA
jgi:hypothetical protein